VVVDGADFFVRVFLAILTNRYVMGLGLLAVALLAIHEWDVRKIEVKHEKKIAAEVAKRHEAVSEFVVSMSTRTTALQADLAAERSKIKTETQTLLKTVTNYVSANADSKCVVPAGFVQHHNASWGVSALSLPAVELVEKPSGIPLSCVGSVSSENAGSAKEWRSEALGWRRWYAERSAEHAEFCRKTKACAALPRPVASEVAGAFGK
jgi:hypothetical protein